MTATGVGLLLVAMSLPSFGALRPEYGGTVRLAAFGSLTLDPAALTLPTNSMLAGLVFETLVSVDATGAIVPGLAQDWQLSADRMSVSFGLGPVLFSNAEPLTPAMVVASLLRLKGTDQEWLTSSLILGPVNSQVGTPLDSMVAPIDANAVPTSNAMTRVQFRLRAPDPMILFKLAHPATAISRLDKDGTPIGTGPFSVSSSARDGHHVMLGPNPYYRDGPPYLESIDVTLLDAVEAGLRELERGQLDLSPVPIDQVDRLAGGVPELKLHTLRNLETVCLLLHPTRFGKGQKEWILSRLDLASMVSFRLRGHGIRARCFEPRLTPYAEEVPAALPPSGSAPPSTRPLRLLVPAHLPLAQQLAARIRGELQGHGAAIELELLGPSALDSRLSSGDFDLALVFARSLGSPPLTLLDWAQTLRQPLPVMDAQLASWLLADEGFQRLPSVLPLFAIDANYAAQSRLVDLNWSPDGRPILEQTWWKPRLDSPER